MTQVFFICLAGGFLLLTAEVFLPGGVLGAIGGLLLLASIVTAFVAFPAYGPYVALAVLLLGALALYWWLAIFPKTRLGNRLIPKTDLRAAKAGQTGLESLHGKEGLAVTPLRPAGFATIEGRRIDVVTNGDMISSGDKIRVVDVEGNRVVVVRCKESIVAGNVGASLAKP